MNEAWHICVDFPAYEVSSRGRVRRRAFVRGKPPVVLPEWSGGSNDHQYPKVNLQKEGRGYKVFVHRLVGAAFYGLTRDHVIDHRNHNTHDLTQIRVATPTENARNSHGRKNSTSRFKGVSWDRTRANWYAYISLNGRTKSLGRYQNEEDAARAYDAAASIAWGVFAFLNFPQGRADEFSGGGAQ